MTARASATFLGLSLSFVACFGGDPNPSLRCDATRACPSELVCYRGFCVRGDDAMDASVRTSSSSDPASAPKGDAGVMDPDAALPPTTTPPSDGVDGLPSSNDGVDEPASDAGAGAAPPPSTPPAAPMPPAAEPAPMPDAGTPDTPANDGNAEPPSGGDTDDDGGDEADDMSGDGDTAVMCPTGLTACGGLCVPLLTSWLHCGACGTQCDDGNVCLNGICCDEDEMACDGRCVNPRKDRKHCGGCGQTCTKGKCKDGSCEGES